MNETTLAAEIRAKLGSPSLDELSNDSLIYAIRDALSELSRLQPYYVYNNIDLQKGVQTYSVDDDIVDVVNFWFTPKAQYSTLMKECIALGAGIPVSNYQGMSVFHNPSLINIIEEKWERVRNRDVSDWEFNPDTRELFIIPAPTTSGKGIYKGTLKRTLETVPEKYEGAFKDLVKAMSMESWIVNKSQITSIPIGVGSVRYSTESMEKSAASIKEKALEKLRGGGSVVVIG